MGKYTNAICNDVNVHKTKDPAAQPGAMFREVINPFFCFMGKDVIWFHLCIPELE